MPQTAETREMWSETLDAVQVALHSLTAEDVHRARNLLRAARHDAGPPDTRADDQPITLGALIVLLESRSGGQEVRFDFGGTQPDGLSSYHGYYDHLAIQWRPVRDTARVTVRVLLGTLRDLVGTRIPSYDGLTRRVTLETPLWVSDYNGADNTAVIGLAACEHTTVIATAFCEHWAGA